MLLSELKPLSVFYFTFHTTSFVYVLGDVSPTIDWTDSRVIRPQVAKLYAGAKVTLITTIFCEEG